MPELQEILSENCNLVTGQNRIKVFHSSYLTTAIIMFILSPATIILNLVTIYVFFKENRMKTVTDILLCFLTVTDIIAGLVAIPSFAAESMLRAEVIGSTCSMFLIARLAGYFSVAITLVTSVLIVLDRYFFIFQPYHYDIRKYQTGFATLVVILSWCLSIVVCLLSIITPKHILAIAFISVTDLSYVILSTCVHLKVLIRAKKIQREIAIEKSHFEKNDSKICSWYRIKGGRMTAVIFGGILICYAPQLIVAILVREFNYSRPFLIAFHWTTGLLLLNPIINPMVYIWQMKWFRQAFWKFVSKSNVFVTNNTSKSEWHVSTLMCLSLGSRSFTFMFNVIMDYSKK